ncbi:hypothetical protein D3C71_2070810 [compost metagenome]
MVVGLLDGEQSFAVFQVVSPLLGRCVRPLLFVAQEVEATVRGGFPIRALYALLAEFGTEGFQRPTD